MSLIDKLDIINCKSWMSIGDCNYEYDYPEEGQIPPSGVGEQEMFLVLITFAGHTSVFG